jgi:hypothetical protein
MTFSVDPLLDGLLLGEARAGGDAGAIVITLVVIALAFWALAWFSQRRQGRVRAEQSLIMHSQAKEQQEYHEVMMEQTRTQTRLNQMLVEKFTKESQLLDVQLELARRDLAMRGDQLHYHDTMMEKVRIEIESLKLQVREQHKRLDEF